MSGNWHHSWACMRFSNTTLVKIRVLCFCQWQPSGNLTMNVSQQYCYMNSKFPREMWEKWDGMLIFFFLWQENWKNKRTVTFLLKGLRFVFLGCLEKKHTHWSSTFQVLRKRDCNFVIHVIRVQKIEQWILNGSVGSLPGLIIKWLSKFLFF